MAEGLRAEMKRSLAMYYSNIVTINATKAMTDDAETEFKRDQFWNETQLDAGWRYLIRKAERDRDHE